MTNDSAKGHHADGPHLSVAFYIGIWVVLLLLTSLTFAVSQVAPPSLHLPAALAIAITKVTLVALFFMHLKYSSGATRMTMVLSVGFAVLLMAGVLADIHTRFPLTNPPDSDLSGMAKKTLEAREAYGPKTPVVIPETEGSER